VFDDAGFFVKTPAGGRRFSSPQAAANDAAGMGLTNQAYLDSCLSSSGGMIIRNETTKGQRRSRPPEDGEESIEPNMEPAESE